MGVYFSIGFVENHLELDVRDGRTGAEDVLEHFRIIKEALRATSDIAQKNGAVIEAIKTHL